MIKVDEFLTSTRKDALEEIKRINEMRAAVIKRSDKKGLTTTKQRKQYQCGLDIEKILNAMKDGDYRQFLYLDGIRKRPTGQARMNLL